jgi:6-phosphogluconolactonase
MSTALRQVIIGGYTQEMSGVAVGVTSLVETRPGELVERDVLALASPTYLIAHPDQPWLFAVSEGSPSVISSLQRDAEGRLSLISSVETGGDFACHLALAPDGRHLVVAHYGSGSVASVAVLDDGRLSERLDLYTFVGTGPDPDRQEGPHAHQVVFDGDQLLVADLGTDRLHRLNLGPEGRFASAGPAVELAPGSGPRHLVIIGDHLVVACELSAELWLGVRDGPGWRHVQTVPSSTRRASEPIAPSALRADGQEIFVANRFAGTVAAFHLDRSAPALTMTDEFDCGGPVPRDLVLDAGHLWVANQTSDLVSVFERGEGSPRPAFQLTSPTPACIVLTSRGAR